MAVAGKKPWKPTTRNAQRVNKKSVSAYRGSLALKAASSVLWIAGGIAAYRGNLIGGGGAMVLGSAASEGSDVLYKEAKRQRARARMWEHVGTRKQKAAGAVKSGIKNAGRVSKAYSAQKNTQKVGSRGGSVFVKAHFRNT